MTLAPGIRINRCTMTAQEITPTKRASRAGNLADGVYQALRRAIIEQAIAPGTKLPEDSVGESFGVSRTVVRTVLQRLSHDHVVEIRPNRGAVVCSLSIEEVRDIFEARSVIEDGVIQLACQRRSTDDIDGLQALVAEEQDAFQSGDRGTWIRLSGEFHLRVAEISGNRTLANNLRALVSRTSLAISEFEAPGRSACSQPEHLAIIDAIEAGDEVTARDLMRRHLAGCEASLDLESRDAAKDLRAVFFDVFPPSKTAGTSA